MNKIDKLLKAKNEGKTRVDVKSLKSEQYDYIIAIDPDVDKSGICVLNTHSRNVKVYEKRFIDLMEYLTKIFSDIKSQNKSCILVDEGCWSFGEGKHNHHVTWQDNKRTASSKGFDLGRNQQVSIMIAEYAEHIGYTVEVQEPLVKKHYHWTGTDGKAKHEDIIKFYPNLPHTAQEGRDAFLLAWHRAGFDVDNNKALLNRIIGK